MEEHVVVDIKTIEKAKRRARRREWISRKSKETSEWLKEHRTELAAAAPIVFGVTAKSINTVAKHQRLKKTQDLKDLYCYDRSLGHYWKLKRKLTNKEWAIIAQRKKNGERLADILADLKVLK